MKSRAAGKTRRAAKTPRRRSRSAARTRTPERDASGLRTYRRKRRFDRTSEPRGKVRKRAGGALSFVVQKHDASRVHYDFRLEMEGVLRSWAVPKGPSLDPSVRRFAAHVEDHPLDYGSFEGVIPEGEYGGGPVVVWDRGTWIPDGDPVATYRKGHLNFRLEGERLRGGWHLVRMGGADRAGKGGKDWLLIKQRDEHVRTGRAADAAHAKGPESVVSNRDLADVLANPSRTWKSSRAATRRVPARIARAVRKRPSRAATTRRAAPRTAPRQRAKATASRRSKPRRAEIEGARPAPLPDAAAPQLATLVDAAPEGDAWIHELKFDGYRLLCRIEDRRARLLTRRGKDWTERFRGVARAAESLPVRDALLDGEIVVLLPDGRSDFQTLQNALTGGRDDDLVYYAFDLLHVNGHDVRGAPLLARKEALEKVVAGGASPSIRYSAHIVGKGPAFLRAACGRGLEGIISKRADAPYSGGRGRAWLKIKCGRGQEFVIVGWTDPEGSRTGLGSLLVAVYDEAGDLRYAGKVGTGFTEEALHDLKARMDAIPAAAPPVVNPPRGHRARGMHWVEPRLVGEVRFTEWTQDGRLRHPSFQGLRMDKAPKDVVREREAHARRKSGGAAASRRGRASAAKTTARRSTPVSRRSDAGPPARRRARPAPGRAAPRTPVDAAALGLTNPGRELFAEQGLTKLDVARYYLDVAEWIVPELRNRPLTLVRCPEGRKGGCFYQKHRLPGAPGAILPVEVPQADGKVDEYMAVRSIDGVIGLVQLGVLEIHAWGCRSDRIEQPDRVTFDLDPDPTVPWKEVIATARLLREDLEDFGFRTFLKVTGGKGLHVVVPLTRRASQDWALVKRFSHEFVLRIVGRAPDRFTANPLKARRRGRIFLDYLRNARGATAIAAYSTRAKPGAPVAVPIEWDELTESLRPDQFTVENVPARMRSLRRDPWADMDRVRQSITATMLRSLGRKIGSAHARG